MKMLEIRLIAAALATVSLVLLDGCGSKTATAPASKASNTGTSQASAASFYRGKTLTIIVPYGPGGGYDQWPRIISPYMQKYLGVDKVLVVNQPGGGGLVGTNKIYAAQADGLTIGDTNAAGDVFSQLAKDQGVSFDVSKFNWVGRPDNDPHIVAVHADGLYKSFADLLQAGAKGVTLKALATGAGSSDYNAAVITYNAFKTRFQMVAAFSGSSDEKAAFLSGNGDTMSVSASDIAQISSQAKTVLLISDQPFDKLPNVPTVMDLAKQQNLPDSSIKGLQAMVGVMGLGHAFFAPPGMLADRLATLRVAFQKSLEDPSFIAAAENANLYVGYASSDNLKQMTDTAMSNASLFEPLLSTNQ